MDKRLKNRLSRHAALCETREPGCMKGLIGFIYSHQSGSRKKVIFDKRRSNTNAFGGYLKNRLNSPSKFDDKCNGNYDAANYRVHRVAGARKSVKRLMQEEMSAKQNVTRRTMVIKLRHLQIDSVPFGHARKNSRRAYHRPLRHPWKCAELSLNKLNVAALLEAFYSQQYQKNAAEGLVDQILTIQAYLSNDQAGDGSKQFSEALRVLDLKNEFLQKLREDRDSEIRNSEEPERTSKLRKQSLRKFMKKIKSLYGNVSDRSDDPRPLNRIGAFKPCSIGKQKDSDEIVRNSQVIERNKRHSFNSSCFSFIDMKRKLTYAMGENVKEQKCIANDGMLHKRWPKISLIRDTRSSNRSEASCTNGDVNKILFLSNVSHSGNKDFNINLEAKRHISARLSNGDEDKMFSSKQVPRTLLNILSSPEYDFSATLGSVRDREHGHVPAEMRYSPCSKSLVARLSSEPPHEDKKTQSVEDQPRDDHRICDKQPQIVGSKPTSPENLLRDTDWRERICPTVDNSTSSTSSDAAIMNKETECTKCSLRDPPSENQPQTDSMNASSSSSSSNCIAEDYSSPVSVLEPCFVEDVTNLTTTKYRSANLPPRQLNIEFEEHCHLKSPPTPKLNLSTYPEDKNSISVFVRAVVESSGLNWDELPAKCHLSDQLLLHPCLIDGLELYPIEDCNDHSLLVDCINETLSEVHQHYFWCSPISFLIQKVPPVSLTENVVNEVMERLNGYLLPPLTPRKLEDIVRRDVEKSERCIDLRPQIEDIVIEIVGAILEELAMETAWEFQF